MREMWGNVWLRLAVTAVVLCIAAYFAVWSGTLTANAIVIKSNLGLGVAVNASMGPPLLKPELLLIMIPVVPFWLAAETGLKRKGVPLPFGSYALFGPVFFFVLIVSVIVDISTNQNNSVLGFSMLAAGYIGAGLLGAAAGGAYYLGWQWRENRRPDIVPDVF